MSDKTLCIALLIAAAPLSAAQAQYASPPPLYPYAVQNGYGVQTVQPYAVQVAPNTYVIQRPEPQRDYPYVSARKRAAVPAPGKFDRPHKPVDHTLVDELRKRTQKKSDTDQASVEPVQKNTVNKTKIVRHPPVVRQTTRYVDDPPRVIDQITVDDSEETPNRGLLTQPRRAAPRATGSVELQPPPSDKGPRTISADAEVTILGPDRMTIKLFRKGQGPFAKAKSSD
jgi:hypothetical protein